jgi:hypothetical protein
VSGVTIAAQRIHAYRLVTESLMVASELTGTGSCTDFGNCLLAAQLHIWENMDVISAGYVAHGGCGVIDKAKHAPVSSALGAPQGSLGPVSAPEMSARTMLQHAERQAQLTAALRACEALGASYCRARQLQRLHLRWRGSWA